MALGENNQQGTKTPTEDTDFSKLTDEELYKQLSEKQRKWCHEYIIDWNGSRAARAAGYNANSTSDIGFQNSRKLKLKEYCKRIATDIEKEAGLSKLKIINEYAKIAFSSIAHLHDSWIEKKAFDELTEEQKSCIQEIQTQTRTMHNEDSPDVEVEFVKVRLYSKQNALDSLKKIMGYDAPEKKEIEHTGALTLHSLIADED